LTKIYVNVGICLGNNRDNFQLNRFIKILQKFFFWGEGAIFWLTL